MPVAPLPPGKVQFIDGDGAPLVAGKVYHYYPNGTTPKDTWQNYGATILNSNPITLDSRGQAPIWGSGRYRQIVEDADGNEIWDRETFVSEATMAADVVMFFGGNPDQPTQLLGGEFITRAINFAADLEGSGGLTPETEPDADYTVTIEVNGVVIATATRDVSEAEWVFATTGNTEQEAPAQSELKFYGPLTPGTIAGFGLTLKGTEVA